MAHARFGRCFRNLGASGGRRARFVGIWPVLAPSEGTPPGHDRDAVVRFQRNFVGWYLGWNEEPPQNFGPIRGRLAGEPAFRRHGERLEVTGRTSDWNGRRWPAPIGLKFWVGTFLGYRNIPSKSRAWRTRGLGDASETWGRRGGVVHVSWAFGPFWHRRRGPLRDMTETPSCVFSETL